MGQSGVGLDKLIDENGKGAVSSSIYRDGNELDFKFEIDQRTMGHGELKEYLASATSLVLSCRGKVIANLQALCQEDDNCFGATLDDEQIRHHFNA